jgi:CelD/BcsL family acetyltransferase involved in cellulose biosynthesis
VDDEPRELDPNELSFELLDPFTQADDVEAIWLSLLGRGSHSFFLSWGWVSTWLNTLPADTALHLYVGYLKDDVVLCFFAGFTVERRHWIFRSRSLFLNATGRRFHDKIAIEHNAILIDSAFRVDVVDLVDCVPGPAWDEFHLPGISHDAYDGLKRTMQNRKLDVVVQRDCSSFFVDLQRVRDEGYFSLLSPNKRQQIRRSMREYEKGGAIRIVAASALDEARQMLRELAVLHEREWAQRGTQGAFSNNYFSRFHETLIDGLFHKGEIQVLRIDTESLTIGYLYNFLYQGNAYFYQSGLNYMPGNVHRPGLVAHYMAVHLNADLNYAIYDFLGGDSQYKASLSTDVAPMMWAKLQKRRVRFRIENMMKAAKRKLLLGDN